MKLRFLCTGSDTKQSCSQWHRVTIESRRRDFCWMVRHEEQQQSMPKHLKIVITAEKGMVCTKPKSSKLFKRKAKTLDGLRLNLVEIM